MVAFSSVRRGEGLTDPQGLWARSTAEQIMSGGRMPQLMQDVGLTICGFLLNLCQGFREFLPRPCAMFTEPRSNGVPRQNFHLGTRGVVLRISI